jgi:hypothetical protein
MTALLIVLGIIVYLVIGNILITVLDNNNIIRLVSDQMHGFEVTICTIFFPIVIIFCIVNYTSNTIISVFDILWYGKYIIKVKKELRKGHEYMAIKICIDATGKSLEETEEFMYKFYPKYLAQYVENVESEQKIKKELGIEPLTFGEFQGTIINR